MPTSLTLEFIQTHPREAARLVSQMPLRQVFDFLREVPHEAVSRLIAQMPASTGAHCLQSLDSAVAASVIEDLDITTAALLLRRLEPQRRRAILSALQTIKATPLQLVLDYAPGTVGASMDPRAMTLLADVSVDEALRQVRMSHHKRQHYFFILGDQHNVLGYVSLHDLLFASKQSHVGALMHTEIETIPARSRLESARYSMQWRDLDILPVVNQRQAYLGVLRFGAVHPADVHQEAPAGAGFDVLWGVVEACWWFIGQLLTSTDREMGSRRRGDG